MPQAVVEWYLQTCSDISYTRLHNSFWQTARVHIIFRSISVKSVPKHKCKFPSPCSMVHHSIPIPTNIWLVILLTVCYTNLVMLVWRICYWINTNNPFIGVFLFSHYLSAWYCFDIIRRNSVLVSHGSYTVKGQIIPFMIHAHTKWFVVQWRPLGCYLK